MLFKKSGRLTKTLIYFCSITGWAVVQALQCYGTSRPMWMPQTNSTPT